MSIVTAQSVHRAFGNHTVLRAADMSIAPGERVGVVGLNGAGKSTLSRILAGTEPADSGTVARRRGATIAYLEQVPHFEGDPTAFEAVTSGLVGWTEAVQRHEAASRALARGEGNLELLLEQQHAAQSDVERLGGWDRQHKVEAFLDHLGIHRTDAKVSSMSGGEQRRVALARVLISSPDLAILDEPTNHLDAETIEWLEQYLIDEYKNAILLITHDRYLLDRVAERTVEVANGEVYSYDGGYERYLEQKAERLAHAERTESNRQNFLRKELEWLSRQPKARSTKQKARIDRAEAAKSVQVQRADRTAALELSVVRSGKTILELRDLRVEIGGRVLIDSLTMFLTEGERIGIVGPNGSGKTTLLKTMLGELAPARGSVVLGQNTKVAYFDQRRSGLDDSKSIWDNVVGDQSKIELGGEIIEPRSYLERFAFDSHKQRQQVGSLSGGERARVALARLLRQSANLVVLDEPTNDLDTATLGALESMLVDFGVTALVVTHDRWFLDRVATSVLAFEDGGRALRYPRNYETYRRLKAQQQAERASRPAPAPAPAVAAAPTAAPAARSSKKKGLSNNEQRELSGLPDAIEQAEQRVAELGQALADPKTYAAGGKEIARVTAELEKAKADVERLTLRWEELELKRGE
ncbi:MAG TPA: ABC-F family ATP-binding cassette domain-containing protein [Polyangiaceae bacterium]|nr:ABC-F family ATP-binding cassette domain-containing protein [Polyangiaceae bacterium]